MVAKSFSFCFITPLPLYIEKVWEIIDGELQIPEVLQSAGTRHQNEYVVGGTSLLEEAFPRNKHPTLWLEKIEFAEGTEVLENKYRKM